MSVVGGENKKEARQSRSGPPSGRMLEGFQGVAQRTGWVRKSCRASKGTYSEHFILRAFGGLSAEGVLSSRLILVCEGHYSSVVTYASSMVFAPLFLGELN